MASVCVSSRSTRSRWPSATADSRSWPPESVWTTISCGNCVAPASAGRSMTLVDTSVAVALVVADHEHHEATFGAPHPRHARPALDTYRALDVRLELLPRTWLTSERLVSRRAPPSNRSCGAAARSRALGRAAPRATRSSDVDRASGGAGRQVERGEDPSGPVVDGSRDRLEAVLRFLVDDRPPGGPRALISLRSPSPARRPRASTRALARTS